MIIIWIIALAILWFFFWLGFTHQWYYQDLEESEVKGIAKPNKSWNVILGDKLFGWLR
jgi:hypothetical protein